ncbi:hypothetical protein IC757_08370 [Wenzhouxiangella sp. AB-CW3]|uniref:hypothetical protein n=1 Tax=Wenzhouxiangella sp. AB-CW3 TaxID=2771012 RepID=UPI00168AC4FA|nr:hypothetical protein [Wenzhouxiangella sp. AB-CW3]QOC24099.1 hypothetical protein IC757_08370 [Wenzhouxiangella sp. AB-CW3]
MHSKNSRIAICAGIGIVLGILFGTAMNNMALGIAAGPAIAVILAVVFGSFQSDTQHPDNERDDTRP